MVKVGLGRVATDQGKQEVHEYPAVAMRTCTANETRGGGGAWAGELVRAMGGVL